MRTARLLCAHAALAALSLCARTGQPLGGLAGDDTTMMELAEPATRAENPAGGYTFNLGREDSSGKKGAKRGRPKKTTATKSKAGGGAKAKKTAPPIKTTTTDMEVAPPFGSAPPKQQETDKTADALNAAAGSLDALFAGDQRPRAPTAPEEEATTGTRTREPEKTIASIAPGDISADALALYGAPAAPEGKRRRFLADALECVGGACRMAVAGATRIYNLVAVVATALSIANMVVSVWVGMFGLGEKVLLAKVVLWILAALLPKYRETFAKFQTAIDIASLLNVGCAVFGAIRSGTAQPALQTLLARAQALVEAAKRDPQGVFRDFVRTAMDGARGAADRVRALAAGVLPPPRTRLEPGLFPERPSAFGNATLASPGGATIGQSGFGQSTFGHGGYSAPGNVSYANPAPYGYGQSPSGFGQPSGFEASGFGTPQNAGFSSSASANLSSPFGPAGYSSPAGLAQQQPQLLLAPPPPKVPAGILNTAKPRAFVPRPDNSRALVAVGGVTSHGPETASAAFQARAAAEDLGKFASSSNTAAPIFNATEHAVDPASAKSLLGLAVPILEGLGATDAETSTIYSTYIAPAADTLDQFLHPGAGSAVGYVSTAINVFGFATSAVILGMQIAGLA